MRRTNWALLFTLAISGIYASGALAQNKRQEERTSSQAQPQKTAMSTKERCCKNLGFRWDGPGNTCYTPSQATVSVLVACIEGR